MGPHARRIAIGSVLCAALITTACTAGTNGTGTTAPGLTRPAPASSPSRVESCARARYCDTFDNAGTGWAVENEPHYFAGYDTYLGGTYRMGERTGATVSEPAPADITKITADYGIQVDVDAVLAPTMPTGTSFGVSCWEHRSKDGSSTGAFVFLVSATETRIGLWSDADGAFHDIVTEKTPGRLKAAGRPNHVTVTCRKDSSAAGLEAELAITVNGTRAASTSYAKSARAYTWDVGSHVGLLASGRGSDVFYDNFALSAT